MSCQAGTRPDSTSPEAIILVQELPEAKFEEKRDGAALPLLEKIFDTPFTMPFPIVALALLATISDATARTPLGCAPLPTPGT